MEHFNLKEKETIINLEHVQCCIETFSNKQIEWLSEECHKISNYVPKEKRKKKCNSTDLHVQYRMEEGKDFQWIYGSCYTGRYNSNIGYSREYAQWIEEKYLEILNNK